MQSRSIWLIILIFFFAAGEYGLAQSSAKNSSNNNQSVFDRFEWADSQRSDKHEINIVGGYSFHSTRGFWGKISDATLSIFVLRYNRKLFNYNGNHILEYVGEINLSANYNLADTPQIQSGSYQGFGAAPIGFQFNLYDKNLIQPFLKSSTGFMLFGNRFPDERGTQFNFTLELGGGLEIMVAKSLSFTMGYKYHHMSNGQFGDINPGVDSNIFYTGITIF